MSHSTTSDEVLHRSPQRITRLAQKGWRQPAGAVYVGPGSRWDARRFIHWCRPVWLAHEFDIQDPRWPAQGLRLQMDLRPDIRRAVRTALAGRDLVCWCPQGDANCHAEVLLAAANAPVGAHLSAAAS